MNQPPKPSSPPPEKADPNKSDTPPARSEASSPIGAILVTSFLALMILISWFGMYLLDFLRS